MSICTHESLGVNMMLSHAFPNGEVWERCQQCGFTNKNAQTVFDKKKCAPPAVYLRRRVNSLASNSHNNWTENSWGTMLSVKSFADAEQFINDWNGYKPNVTDGWQYKLPLHCERCYSFVSETYAGGLCYSCGKEEKMVKGLNKHAEKLLNPKPTLVRKEGDIWTLDQINAPFNSSQYAYQGSGKAPYVITCYASKRDGAVTSDGWACSCMNFTRHTPRTPCKHILNIMLKHGFTVTKHAAAVKLANVDEKKLAEFEKWQREQAATKKAVPTAGAALALFGVTTRKFR